MFCPKCGIELEDSFNVCPHCGTNINDSVLQKTSSINEEDGKNKGLWLLIGFFVPLAGLILYLVWKDEKPITAKQCGKGALISVCVSIGIFVVVTLVYFILVSLLLMGIA